MIYFLSFFVSLVLLLATPLPVAAGKVVLTVVGDILLAGSASPTLSREGYDYPFAATAAILRGSDIAVGNLESPIASRGVEFTEKKYRFKASPKAASALRKVGFSVMTLANNHIMDFGALGLIDTLENLDKERILHAGAGRNLVEARKPAIIDKNGQKIVFLAYSLTYPVDFYAGLNQPGAAPGYVHFFLEDIKQAKARADHVVISFHWGVEGAVFPKSYQVAVARRAIDAGADVVIGHHPHVLQGIERYKGRLILYSLGNYTFGSLSKNAVTSVMAKIVLERGVREVELFPLNVMNAEVRFQPALLQGLRGRQVISRLQDLSRQWNTEIVTDGKRYFVRKEPRKTTVALW
ncbi:MAG: CapA family protein [Deltaproteobacteria bacterium]|nr:CapA family protein [Deltaproteobacteria bacterium]